MRDWQCWSCTILGSGATLCFALAGLVESNHLARKLATFGVVLLVLMQLILTIGGNHDSGIQRREADDEARRSW